MVDKAYNNLDFLNSPQARILRLMAEYLEPKMRFENQKVTDTIVVFGSARLHDDENTHPEMRRYYRETRELAKRLTEWSQGLQLDTRHFAVCGGGGPGIMEATNRGADDAGGVSVGLGISLPNLQETMNSYVPDELGFEFHYFSMRKFWFLYLAKVIVVMPGGFGTLDEIMEVLTLMQTKKIKKPMAIVLYGTEYWDEVINMDAMVKYGTISAADLDRFHRSSDVDDSFNYIVNFLEEHYLKQPTELETTTRSDIQL